jgi:hypothetical protein
MLSCSTPLPPPPPPQTQNAGYNLQIPDRLQETRQHTHLVHPVLPNALQDIRHGNEIVETPRIVKWLILDLLVIIVPSREAKLHDGNGLLGYIPKIEKIDSRI